MLPQCAIQSHVETRMTLGFHLDAGIYVRTGPDKDMVHKAPVGELELLDNHRSVILTAPDCTPAIWNTRFNTWRTSSDAEEAKQVFATIKKAKAFQTPMKRPKIDDGMLLKVLFQELTAVDILGYDDLQSHLKSYEKIWVD